MATGKQTDHIQNVVESKLNIVQELYCDTGPYKGKYKITLTGYVTSEELEKLR